MLEHFTGRRIVSSGVSLDRQVFLRTVAHLRGFEATMEHYFDGHAVYARNGTHGVLSLHDELVMGQVAGYLAGPRMVELEFRRAPSNIPNQWELDLSKPQVLAMAVNIHRAEHCFEVSKFPEQVNALLSGSPYLEHVLWLTTASRHGKWEEDYSRRNAAMRVWAVEAQKRLNVTVTVVGVDKLVEQSPWERNAGGDDAHFQCSSLNEYPAYIRLNEIKTPDSADCRDLLNLNVVQLIAGRLCSLALSHLQLCVVFIYQHSSRGQGELLRGMRY